MKTFFANNIHLAIQARDPFFFNDSGFLGFADADLVARWAGGSMHPYASPGADEAEVNSYPAPVSRPGLSCPCEGGKKQGR